MILAAPPTNDTGDSASVLHKLLWDRKQTAVAQITKLTTLPVRFRLAPTAGSGKTSLNLKHKTQHNQASDKIPDKNDPPDESINSQMYPATMHCKYNGTKE